MGQDKISVIVPVYKAERYLQRCVDSILAQTYQNLELILVDDGSPDNSGAICDAYAQQNSRVAVIHQKNSGVSAARNAGLDWSFANSDSQWIHFVDSDDWIHPRMLEALMDANRKMGTKISACTYHVVFNHDFRLEDSDASPVRMTPHDLYKDDYICAVVAWGKLYCKECFAGIRYPLGRTSEDGFITHQVLFAENSLAFLPASLYAYFYNCEGITQSPWSVTRMDDLDSREAQLDFFAEREWLDLMQVCMDAYLDICLRYLYQVFKLSQDKAQRKELIRYIWRKLGKAIGYCSKYHLKIHIPVLKYMKRLMEKLGFIQMPTEQ